MIIDKAENNIKIGFICSSLSFGGLEMNIVRMAKWMQQSGTPTILLCLKESKIDQYANEDSVNREYIKSPSKYLAAKSGFKLYKLIIHLKITHIVYRHNNDLSALIFAKIFSGGRIRLIYHQAMQIGVSKRDIFHTIKFSFIDAWISTLPGMAKRVLELTAIRSDKVHVIPLGTEIDRIVNAPKVNIREELNLNNNHIVIGVLGRFSPQKGQLFVIESLKNILAENPHWRILLAGEPTMNKIGEDYYNQLKLFLKKNNLEKQVILYGFTNNISSFFTALDVFVVSSTNETYGMVTVEALISGVKIVASNTGGTVELMENGRYGFLFSPTNKKEFVGQLISALNSDSKTYNCQDEIFAKFDHHKQICRMKSLICKLKS